MKPENDSLRFLMIIFGILFLVNCHSAKTIEYVSYPNPKVTVVNEIKYDTAYGVLACADTSRTQSDWHGTNIFYMYGYEVTVSDMVGPVHMKWLDSLLKEPRYIIRMLYQLPKR